MLVSGLFNFPLGVLLYWFTSNLWTMGQQVYIIRFHPHDAPEANAPEVGALGKSLAPKPGAKPQRKLAVDLTKDGDAEPDAPSPSDTSSSPNGVNGSVSSKPKPGARPNSSKSAQRPGNRPNQSRKRR